MYVCSTCWAAPPCPSLFIQNPNSKRVTRFLLRNVNNRDPPVRPRVGVTAHRQWTRRGRHDQQLVQTMIARSSSHSPARVRTCMTPASASDSRRSLHRSPIAWRLCTCTACSVRTALRLTAAHRCHTPVPISQDLAQFVTDLLSAHAHPSRLCELHVVHNDQKTADGSPSCASCETPITHGPRHKSGGQSSHCLALLTAERV